MGCKPAWKARSHVSDGAELIKLCQDLAAKLLGPREPEDEEKGLSKGRVFQGRDLERTAEGEARNEGRNYGHCEGEEATPRTLQMPAEHELPRAESLPLEIKSVPWPHTC